MSAKCKQERSNGVVRVPDQGAIVFREPNQVVPKAARHDRPGPLAEGLAEIQLSPALL